MHHCLLFWRQRFTWFIIFRWVNTQQTVKPSKQIQTLLNRWKYWGYEKIFPLFGHFQVNRNGFRSISGFLSDLLMWILHVSTEISLACIESISILVFEPTKFFASQSRSFPNLKSNFHWKFNEFSFSVHLNENLE